jgi:WD40 repeat protein
LTALNPDGTERWTSTVAGAAAIGLDGVVYVGSGHTVSAVDPIDGSIHWSRSTGVPNAGRVTAPTLGPNGRIFLAGDAGLVVLERTGEIAWKREELGPLGTRPAIAADGSVYVVAALAPNLASPSVHLYVFTANGEPKWDVDIGSASTEPMLAADGGVYLSTQKGLVAFDADGNLEWSRPGYVYSAAVGADGTIYLNKDLKFEAVHPDGSLRWSRDGTFGKFLVDSKGNSYMVWSSSFASDGELASYDADGNLRWTRRIVFGEYAQPAMAKDGTLYLVRYSAFEGRGDGGALDAYR